MAFESVYQALPAFPYYKQQKAEGGGLEMRLGHTFTQSVILGLPHFDLPFALTIIHGIGRSVKN